MVVAVGEFCDRNPHWANLTEVVFCVDEMGGGGGLWLLGRREKSAESRGRRISGRRRWGGGGKGSREMVSGTGKVWRFAGGRGVGMAENS